MLSSVHFNVFKQNQINLLTVIKVAALCLILTACIQNFDIEVPRYADKSSLMVSKSTLMKINRTFYGAFSHGNWNYKGAKARAGQVNAYIQIPQELDMKHSVQQQYLRDMVCPTKQLGTDLWQELKHIDLSVHIYTKSKSKSVSAVCVNPTVDNA